MIVGSGNPASKTWDLADFTCVKVRSTFRTKITKGRSFKVTTTADDNIIDKVEVSRTARLSRSVWRREVTR